MEDDKKFLFEMLDQPSPTGYEMNAQRIWANYIKPYVDEVKCDAYGSTYARLKCGKKDAKLLMLDAHSDEIGFVVSYINPDGFLRVRRVGGTDVAVARGRRLRILGDKGELRGVTGNTAIHLRRGATDEKAPKIEELFVDVGASSEQDVLDMGIRIGTVAVYVDGPMEMQGNHLVCRALDNRIGGYILSQVARALHEQKAELEWDIVFVNSVQEEIGCCGAKMAAFRLHPDAGVAIDVSHAIDTPDLSKDKFGGTLLGKGPTVTHGGSNHPLLVQRLVDEATKANVAIQHEAAGGFGGTDTDVIYLTREGIPSALISLPLRYMHSPVETMDWNDIHGTKDLVLSLVKNLKATDDFNHQL